MQIDLNLSPCAKLNSKWIKDLTIRPDNPNLIEEKEESGIEYICEQNSNKEDTKSKN